MPLFIINEGLSVLTATRITSTRLLRFAKNIFPEQEDDYELHHADGVKLEKWSDQSEVFDAVITDPPYVMFAEDYGCSDWDVGKLDQDDYFRKFRNDGQSSQID